MDTCPRELSSYTNEEQFHQFFFSTAENNEEQSRRLTKTLVNYYLFCSGLTGPNGLGDNNVADTTTRLHITHPTSGQVNLLTHCVICEMNSFLLQANGTFAQKISYLDHLGELSNQMLNTHHRTEDEFLYRSIIKFVSCLLWN